MLRTFGYDMPFGKSSDMNVFVSLVGEEDYLRFQTVVNFREFGKEKVNIPALDFVVISDDLKRYIYDNAFGVVERPAYDHDHSALSFVMNGDETGGIVLSTDSKYGYRCHGDMMRVKLIRGSTIPDKFPESYEHVINLYVGLVDTNRSSRLIAKANAYSMECDFVTMGTESGDMAPEGSFYEIEGDVCVSTVKRAEDGSGTVFRVYEANGETVECTIALSGVTTARLIGINEEEISSLDVVDSKVTFTVKPYEVVTVKLA